MICEIAVATSTHPSMWMDTEDHVLATVIEVVNRRAAVGADDD